jgi:hypothetical protein
MKGKLYVITRKDLDKTYAGVQAGHAVFEWAKDNINHNWNNGILIYLVCENEKELYEISNKICKFGESQSKYFEPFMENQLTAIACYTELKIFRKLKML